MRIKRYESCRADGRVFTRVALELDCESDVAAGALAEEGLLRARFLCGNAELPCRVHPYGPGKQLRNECVLDYPVADFRSAVIEVWDSRNPREKGQLKLNGSSVKWESRLNRRLRKARVNKLLACGDSRVPGCFFVEPWHYYQGDGGSAVWRVSVEWDSELTGVEAGRPISPSLVCLDARGNVLDASVLRLEEQHGVNLGDMHVDRVVFSVRMPEPRDAFILLAEDESGAVAPDCSCVAVNRADAMRALYWEETKDACANDEAYRAWLHNQRPSEAELAAQSQSGLADSVMFSLIVPCFNSDKAYLREMVASAVSQSYRNWELLLLDASAEQSTVREVAAEFGDERIRYCQLPGNAGIVGNTNAGIELARGNYIGFLDHDDTLEPDALYRYAMAIADSGAKVLYCDEDSFHANGDYGQPSFKSDFNRDLLYCHNCVTHFLVVAKDVIDRIGVCNEDVAGAQDYDLVLRALAAGFEPYHVPRILYHWRIHEGSSNNGNVGNKPYAVEAGRISLQRHFDSLGIAGSVEALNEPFTYRMHFSLPSPKPLVSVVIPTRDQSEMLEACVESLFGCTYREMEVILVENGSKEPQTEAMYSRLQQKHSGKIKVVRWEKGFNYSALINFGASFAQGEYLLLLNNDTKVISPDCIEEMLGYLQRPEVGVVGPKLYFKDGLVQHAGMLVGPYDALVHVHQFFPSGRAGYLARAVRPGNFSAVTGACQMVKKSVFAQVGGYDEAFVVGFNDADFCLRVREAGYSVVFTPYAELYHYEFVSRGREAVDEKKQLRWKKEQSLFMKKWPRYFDERDPFSNPNLKRDNLYFALGD